MNLSHETFMVSGSRHAARPWLSQMAARLHELREGWAQRRARSREMQDLHRCSDRELWDMGLSRSDLLSIETGTFRRG